MIPGIVTTILLVAFLAGVAWVWSPRRKAEFDAAAELPLADDAGDSDSHASERTP
ncbi:MAG TPA: cbb3-type cytochrome c oxidase subunit 3 [Arenimonas sp.]|nr:cbb3-type cytochrome c oxidase subunit 3 [Arenimonas sp.]